MNRLGMIIDVSHAHDETFWDVLAITEEIIRRGISDPDIKKILGGNFLRVFNKVTQREKENSSTE
ncbi:MAG: membrane dipeptidase [Candidatus Aminicenantes bacterium]|nr:membrane dipeptidase [Candidatus Aminicenantes bacterium]